VAIGVGGTLVAGEIGSETLLQAGALDEFAPEKSPDYYPPAKLGMRGNHDGTFTFSHRLRDGESPDSFGDPAATGENYDLVVVGAASAASRPPISIARAQATTLAFSSWTITTISAAMPNATNFALADGCC